MKSTAYLHVLMVVENDVIVVKDAMIASQKSTSMTASVTKECYATMFEVEGDNYDQAYTTVIRTIASLAQINPIFKIVFGIVEKKNSNMLAALKLAGFDVSKITQLNK